jgi:hypothetical protein
VKPLIDPSFFRRTAPENDANFFQYYVRPSLLSVLLNEESTLVSAPSGYGKSTLAFLARQQLQREWLTISLESVESLTEDLMTVLFRQITRGMWSYIETQPAAIASLPPTRAKAALYFLERFSDIDVDFLLERLAEDAPAYADTIQAFGRIERKKLFDTTATDTQRLKVLCDCIKKLGMKGVVIWIDLSAELKQLSPAFLQVIAGILDSLHLMRQDAFYLKCFAVPSVCQQLRQLRGLTTLSVTWLELHWPPAELICLINQRFAHASSGQIKTLDQLVTSAAFTALLDKYSDAHSPLEWLTLARLIAEKVNATGEMPLSERSWLNVQRAYCAERVKLRFDEQGSFWRGKHLLVDLTPKKRAIYPLVKYLYEHPGVHRTYNLINALGVDETNLNTMIFRARKEHLEPFLPQAGDSEDAWVYLITDTKGGGYALIHTDRSP